jgi:hypothetical protein
LWLINGKGEKEFSSGKKDWTEAAAEAEKCLRFKVDVEEEMVADETISCYNCRFRRWTSSSFVCCCSNPTFTKSTSKMAH